MEDKVAQNRLPRIMGFNPTSEAGKNIYAASIFVFGCNFRCPYCMNGRIVVVKPEDSLRPVKEIPFDTIKSKIIDGKHDWVQISGGEPTLIPEDQLTNLIDELIGLGCKVGMSTNGTYPWKLAKILHKLSYVALDLKSCSIDDFAKLDIVNKEKSFGLWLESRRMLFEQKLNNPNFDYELRTTAYPSYVSVDRIKNIGFLIQRTDNWVFQQFRHAKNMLIPKEALSHTPYTEKELDDIISEAKKYTPSVYKRYV